MGNLHYGASGGTSYPELAEQRRARIASERVTVDAWLAAGGSPAALEAWCNVPAPFSGRVDDRETRLRAWWDAPAPWTVRRGLGGEDAVRELAQRHGLSLFGADRVLSAPGLERTPESDPGMGRTLVTWRVRGGLRPGGRLCSRTVWGPIDGIAAFESEAPALLAETFDE